MITKEQFNEYMQENWNEHFHGALLQCLKESLFPKTDQKELDEYRIELKQLIWEAVSDGVKAYLEEYNGEAIKIIGKEFAEALEHKTITFSLE